MCYIANNDICDVSFVVSIDKRVVGGGLNS